MNLLDLICKELGVEVGEEWLGSDGYYYHINEYGQVRIWSDEYDEWTESYYNLGHVINGDLKPRWKPVKDEGYYYPRIDFRQGYAYTTWEGDLQDIYRVTNNLVFKTKKEAVEVADKMLNALKEE